MTRFDVLILGGGPSAAVCGAELARMNLKVIIFADHDQRPLFYETLSVDGCRHLRARGLMPNLGDTSSEPCVGVETARFDGFVTFRDFRQSGNALTVEKLSFNSALIEKAERAGACVVRDAEVKASQVGAGWNCSFKTRNGSNDLQTGFIVDAAGRAGCNCGVGQTGRLFFDQSVAGFQVISAPLERPNVLRVCATTEGWSYVVGLPLGRTLVVVLTDSSLLPRSQEERQEFFSKQFAESGVQFKGPFCVGKEWQIRDARTSCRKVLWRRRWLAVGDAAFTISPLSGLGISEAIEQAIAAADAVFGTIRSKSFFKLERYATDLARRFNRLCSARPTALGALFPRIEGSRFWRRNFDQGFELHHL